MSRALRPAALMFALALVPALACEATGTSEAGEPASEAAELAAPEVDPALLRELLGDAVRVEGERVEADGLLVRLAFEPLIRQTGPVELQQVQGQGYRLTGVADGSPLWLLGLRDGDVLTAVDDGPILGREHELRSRFEARPRRVSLAYLRDGEARSLDLKIVPGAAWRSSGRDSSDRDSELFDLLAGARPVPLPSGDRAALALELAAGLRCVAGETDELIARCELAKSAIDALIAAPESLMRQARIVPATDGDGAPRGFKLYGIRRDSVPIVLGLQNGDLVTSVNGRALTTVDAALEAYAALRSETELRVELERRGKRLALEYVLVDALSGPPAPAPGREVSSDPKDPFGSRRRPTRSPAPDLKDPFGP